MIEVGGHLRHPDAVPLRHVDVCYQHPRLLVGESCHCFVCVRCRRYLIAFATQIFRYLRALRFIVLDDQNDFLADRLQAPAPLQTVTLFTSENAVSAPGMPTGAEGAQASSICNKRVADLLEPRVSRNNTRRPHFRACLPTSCTQRCL